MLEGELGAPVDAVFEDFSSRPVASASLAQVYRATLRADAPQLAALSGGVREVAVKVQRPNLEQAVGMDAVVLRQAARMAQGGHDASVERHQRQLRRAEGGGLTEGGNGGGLLAATEPERAPFKIDLPRMVDELVGGIFAELDFVEEARRAERFRRMYCGPGTGIIAPRVVWPLTTHRVLVSEWVEGVKLSEVVARGMMTNEQARVLVHRGVACSLDQLLEGGLFHADPHPGNLIVTPEGLLCYLDFGLCQELPLATRVAMMTALVAYVNGDASALADAAVGMRMLPPEDEADYDRAEVVRALRLMLEERPRLSRAVASGADRADFQGLMRRLGEALGDFQFQLPAELALVARALGSLEGTATILDPKFEVVKSAYPVVVSRILANRSPEVRAVCGALLLDARGGLRWGRMQRILRAAVQTDSAASNEDAGGSSGGGGSGASGLDAEAVEGGIQDASEYLFSPRGAPTRRALCMDAADYAEGLLVAEGAHGAAAATNAPPPEGSEGKADGQKPSGLASGLEAASMVWSVLSNQPAIAAVVAREAAVRAPAAAALAAEVAAAVGGRVAQKGTVAALVAASQRLHEWDEARRAKPTSGVAQPEETKTEL